MDQESRRTIESGGSVVPRRLLRKGTHSCAECKRRKTRCFFDHPSAAVCVGCQRRGTHCVGQEFMDLAASRPEEDSRTSERLNRIEQMLERLTEKVSADSLGNRHDASQSQVLDSRPSAEGRAASQDDRTCVSSLPVRSAFNDPVAESGRNTTQTTQPEAAFDTPAENTAGPSSFVVPEYADTCRTLHAALPSQQNVDTLFGAGRAAIYLQALCNPYSQLFGDGNSLSPSVLSKIPSVTAHPVLLARKFLQLCLCLQQLDPSFDRGSLRLGLTVNEAMQRYYTLASSMVTCHDDLLDSLEGLQCLIFEGAFLVDCGNLRRALVTLRRASTLAQFMRLHRKVVPCAMKQYDPTTRVSSDVAWRHIAYMERYVSLLLDMPTSITDARFASEHKRAGESDAEWLERVQVDLCEHIINRNQSGNYDLAATKRIDDTMNRVVNSIPANWWKLIELRPGLTGDDVMSLVINAQMQIIHYNLLTVLHLPYLLRKNHDHNYDYNKSVCTYASREVLNRYINFRSIVRVVFCCRFVDFCALTACLTLLLAHLGGQGQNSTWLLPHQRPGDRALIEKTIETLDELNQLNNDELTRETAKLARRLLVLEADAAQTGDSFSCGIVDGEAQEDNSEWFKSRNLSLKIPYFGTVMLAPTSFNSAPSMTQTVDTYSITASAINPGLASTVYSDQTSTSLHTPTSHSSDSSHLIQLPQHLSSNNESSFPISNLTMPQQDGTLEMFDAPMPDLLADTMDWAFQGVDVTFFNSLISGQMIDPEDTWNQDYLKF